MIPLLLLRKSDKMHTAFDFIIMICHQNQPDKRSFKIEGDDIFDSQIHN